MKVIKEETYNMSDNSYNYRVTYDVKEVEISRSDWWWIYENIMYDDYDYAFENGLYRNERDFNHMDCDLVCEAFDDWLCDTNKSGEQFIDYNKEFQETFNRLKSLLHKYESYIIHYQHVKEN